MNMVEMHKEMMERFNEVLTALLEDRRQFNWQEDVYEQDGLRMSEVVVGTGTPDQPQMSWRNALPGREEVLLLIDHDTALVHFTRADADLGELGHRFVLGATARLGQFMTIRLPTKTSLWMQSDTADTTVSKIEMTRGNR